MALTDTEREIIQFGKDNNKTLEETKAALARFRNEQAVKPVNAPVQTEQGGGFLEKTSGALSTVFGGEKIGEAIGTQIARGNLGDTIQKFAVGRDLSPEEEAQVSDAPSAKQLAGDVLRTASTFTPVGRIAGLVSKGAKALGIGGKTAQTVGNVAGGATAGAGADVGLSLADGGGVEVGLGTALGAGIPASAPIVGALAKASGKLVGRGFGEITGKLTGTSQETVQQAFDAARTGGQDLETLTNALRGKTTPEQIVSNVRESIALVSQNRSQLFKDTLQELGDSVVSTAPAKKQFMDDLTATGIKVDDNGLLDFSGSKLRTVPNAQNKLIQAWQEIQRMPDNLSIAELDTTRQAIKGIKAIAGDEPSANLANMLIDDAVRSVRMAGEQVDGYGQMLDNFSETSDFLTELEKGLSTGEKATIDTAYRRIATTLKTNNEQRMAVVKELDQATGGALLSEISGQQLSEALPRGLVGTYLAPIVAGGAIAGGVTTAIIPSLLLASPRAVGEFVRALGLGTAKADAFLDAISESRSLLIKAGALSGAEFD